MVKKIKETLSIQIPKLGNTYKLILYFDDYYYTAPWFILHKFTRSRFSERLCVVFNQWHWEVYVINTWLSQITKCVARSTLAVETLHMQNLQKIFFCLPKVVDEMLCIEYETTNIKCYTDSQSLFNAKYYVKCVLDKGLRADIAILQEIIQKKYQWDKLGTIWATVNRCFEKKRGCSVQKLL